VIIVNYDSQAPETFERSIFLAGPTPRSPEVSSWRPEALKILERLGYDGVVFVPEWTDASSKSQLDQRFLHFQAVRWEDKHLNMSDQILFWIPRDMKTMPGLTTNIEFGRWEGSGKIVLGHPKEAPHTSYLDDYANREGITRCNDLEETVRATLKAVRAGSPRTGGERCVPLYIWEKPEFQAWYLSQKKVGNRLDDAKMVWTFRVGKNKERCFMWAIHVKVWIAAEGRFKTNEVILQRPDVFAVVAYIPQTTVGPMDKDFIFGTEVVLVREFRSPGATEDGFIHEVPGGSVMDGDLSPGAKAVEELEEETGLAIPTSRLKVIGSRQLYGTLLTHKAHVFCVRLTDEDRLQLDWMSTIPHGVSKDTEQTFVEIRTVLDLLRSRDVDWANMGMILSTLLDEYWMNG